MQYNKWSGGKTLLKVLSFVGVSFGFLLVKNKIETILDQSGELQT